MSFAQELADTSIKRAKAIQDFQIQKFREFEAEKTKREDLLMKKLTAKYHNHIKQSLWKSALIAGKREKYMNFDHNDFKANFPELGNPADVCNRWLTEMTKEDSPYLPYKLPTIYDQDFLHNTASCYNDIASLADAQYNVSEPPKKDHFAGLNFRVWNNKAFTVHFTW